MEASLLHDRIESVGWNSLEMACEVRFREGFGEPLDDCDEMTECEIRERSLFMDCDKSDSSM